MWYNRTHADIRDKAACASEGKKKGMEKKKSLYKFCMLQEDRSVLR